MVAKFKNSPGYVRDAIIGVLATSDSGLSVSEIINGVQKQIGPTPASSIRSYLRLNSPGIFIREDRGVYRSRQRKPQNTNQKFLTNINSYEKPFIWNQATMHHDDCFAWFDKQPSNSMHAVVTDPPYGLYEYTEEQQKKLRAGKGGVWRIPPSFDGHKRSPLPRFTTLDTSQLEEIGEFFFAWGRSILRVLVPGANVIVASNPLVSHIVAGALSNAGMERRGELIRLTMTMRGGDKPKGAHNEFSGISVMPRSMWEPWLLFRKPIDGRVQDNLRKWKTGGFRRPDRGKPFGDVITSSPTRRSERNLAPHPSLKPQAFLRQLVRGVLPLGVGTVLDPFAGAGSTLAACNAIGYSSIGVEKDSAYFAMASKAIPTLTEYIVNGHVSK